MRRSGSSGPLRIHLVAADAVVSRRVRRIIDNRPHWSSTHSQDLRFPRQTDVVLIPASFHEGRRWAEWGETAPFVVAYGPAEHLELCYLRGCDDYLKDPWDTTELIFRLARFTRSEEFYVGNVCIRVEADRLVSEFGSTGITEGERNVLQMLIRWAGMPVTREALFYAVWGVSGGASRLVDVYVSRLRQRIREVGPAGYAGEAIHSLRGMGYSLDT